MRSREISAVSQVPEATRSATSADHRLRPAEQVALAELDAEVLECSRLGLPLDSSAMSRINALERSLDVRVGPFVSGNLLPSDTREA